MKIRPNQVFLHDVDRYEPDQDYDVEDALGFYFCNVGWADAVDAEVEKEDQPSEVDLDIHNSTIGVKDSNG